MSAENPELDTVATDEPNARWRSIWELVSITLIGIPFHVVGFLLPDKDSILAKLLPVAGVAATLVLTWYFVRANGKSWKDFGMGRPKSWIRTVIIGILAAFGCMVVAMLFNAVLITVSGVEPDVSRFDFLKGNAGALAMGLFSAWIVAAFPEEMVNRGYLLTRLSTAFGDDRRAWLGSAVVTSALFGLGHFYQGIIGILVKGFAGFLFCLVFLLVRKNLWVVIIAHGLIDSVAFVMIYLGGIQSG